MDSVELPNNGRSRGTSLVLVEICKSRVPTSAYAEDGLPDRAGRNCFGIMGLCYRCWHAGQDVWPDLWVRIFSSYAWPFLRVMRFAATFAILASPP